MTCGARDEHSTRSCPISKTCFTCGMKGHINKVVNVLERLVHKQLTMCTRTVQTDIPEAGRINTMIVTAADQIGITQTCGIIAALRLSCVFHGLISIWTRNAQQSGGCTNMSLTESAKPFSNIENRNNRLLSATAERVILRATNGATIAEIVDILAM